jgi:hypothetical protein
MASAHLEPTSPQLSAAGVEFVKQNAEAFDMERNNINSTRLDNLRKLIVYVDGHTELPFTSLEAQHKDRAGAQYQTDNDIDLEALFQDVKCKYCPGAHEMKTFEQLDSTKFHIAAGQLAFGSYIYKLPAGGTIMFSEEEGAISAEDFFVLKNDTSDWTVAKGWQDRLKLLVNAPRRPDDTDSTWKRPPQALYSSISNPDAKPKRSALKVQGQTCLGTTYSISRGKAKIQLEDDVPVFVASVQCKAPGFRITKKDDALHETCCAGIIVTIKGKDAKYMEVEPLEICIHRAAPMVKRHVIEQLTPRAETWNAVVPALLMLEVKKIIGKVATSSEKKLKPALTFGNLLHEITAEEEFTGNSYRAGGTTSAHVAEVQKAQKKGSVAIAGQNPTDRRNWNMQRIINAQGLKYPSNSKITLTCLPGLIQLCDYMNDHKTEVVLFDDYRVKTALAAIEQDPLLYRGIVLDFAMKMVYKMETDNKTKCPLWTLQMVIPHFLSAPNTKATTLTLLEAELSRSNAPVTAAAITLFLEALTLANNGDWPWIPAVLTDVSATLMLACTKAFMGQKQVKQYKNDIINFLTSEYEIAENFRIDFRRVVERLCKELGEACPEQYLKFPLEETGKMRLHSKDKFRGGDVLVYAKEVEPEPQMYLQLSKKARDSLNTLVSRYEETLYGLKDDLATEAHALISRAIPTINKLREQKLTSVFHCRPHKIRAVLGATDHNENFLALGPLQKFAGTVAYRLIIEGYGPADLHDDEVKAPFAGPKDFNDAKTYLDAVGEMLVTQYIPCDTAEWKSTWKDVFELNIVDTSADKDQKDPVYSFEIYAGHKRLHHSIIDDEFVVLGEHIEAQIETMTKTPEMKSQTSSSPRRKEGTSSCSSSDTSDSDTSDSDTSDSDSSDSDSSDSESSDAENLDGRTETDAYADDKTADEISNARNELGHDEDVRIDRMNDAAKLADLLPDFWNTGVLKNQSVEEMMTASVTDKDIKESVFTHGKTYFQNPYYFEAERFVHKKMKKVHPVASLFKYHAALFFITGPLMRALFPACVSHTSHVEGKFSEMRSEMNCEVLEQYLEEKVGTKADGTVNLFESEKARFRVATANRHRVNRRKSVQAAGETYKGGYTDAATPGKPQTPKHVFCKGFKGKGLQKTACTIKANCPFGYCGHHCRLDPETTACNKHKRKQGGPVKPGATELTKSAQKHKE